MVQTHVFQYNATMMRFTCKPCRKVFTRDFNMFSEQDKYCSYCNNKWILPGITPESMLAEEAINILKICLEECVQPSKTVYAMAPQQPCGHVYDYKQA
jgi:NAD-dependent SIR2 family protein deacetylase